MRILGDRILLKVSKEKKVGSIIIPETTQQVNNVGMIMDIGGGSQSRELKIGQIVMFDYYAAQRVIIENEEYYIVRSADIGVILEEAK